MYKNSKYRKTNLLGMPKHVGGSKSDSLPSVEQKHDKNDENINELEADDIMGSQASVPPSQPPTQRRYLSQRSTLMRTQSKSTTRVPNSYYEMVLMKAGVDPDTPDFYTLSVDNVTFVNRLRNVLKSHQDFPNNLKNFFDGFQDAINSASSTTKLLSGCVINISSLETQIQSQESLVMDLLTIDFLQEKIMDILLEKAMECAKNDEKTPFGTTVLQMILPQLRNISANHVETLYDKLIEIFECATNNAKMDVVSAAEYVINPIKHDEFALYLINNTCTDSELFSAVNIEAFTNLSLSSKMQIKLRKRILQYIENGCLPNILPCLIKFLLKVSTDEPAVFRDLFLDIRQHLKWNMDEGPTEVKKSQLEIFNYISQALTRCRKFYDVTLKTITNMPPDENGAIDLIVLLILISIREERSAYIENILRRRLKHGQITSTLLNQTKNTLYTVMEHYSGVLLDIFQNFLKDKNCAVSNFAKHGYKIIFGIEDCNGKKILEKLVELICDKSMCDLKSEALEILKDINEKYPNNMQKYGLLLLPLLDRINDFHLQQFRTVMELLCSIAYPLSPLTDCETLQYHLDMILKKQVISGTAQVKKQGIVGIVQLVHHIVQKESSIEENFYDLDSTINSVCELPDGREKEAANYITRIFDSTTYCPESLALFFDEMAIIFANRNKNSKNSVEKYFLVWLTDLITNQFQNIFVVEQVPTELGIDLAYKNCINQAEEHSENELIPIAIDISGATLRSQLDASTSITILCPLFNLVRVLHFIRYDGSLESINAVLGCAVVLPRFSGSEAVFNIFLEYDEDKCKSILDIYFHTVNWYREAISSFASQLQEDQMIRRKILLRLEELIALEETIRKLLLELTFNYSPPICNFMSLSNQNSPVFKKPGRPKKLFKEKTKMNQTRNCPDTEGMSILATARSQNVSISNTTRVNQSKSNSKCNNFELNYEKQESYRQMDPDIMLILKEKLNPKYPLDEDDRGKCMGLLEFRFIMSDLVNKLESVTGVKKFNSEQPLQYIIYALNLIHDLVQFVPRILGFMKQFLLRISTTLEEINGNFENCFLYTHDMNYVKVCFGLCLRLLAGILNWPGFDDETNSKLLKELFLALNNCSLFQTSPAKSLSELASMAFKKFILYETNILDLKSAVYLHSLLLSMKKFSSNGDISDEETVNLCKKYLQRKWYDFDGSRAKGSASNILLDKILKGFVQNSTLKMIRGVVNVILEEMKLLKKNDDCLQTFPNFSKLNFPMLFRCLGESLLNAINCSPINDVPNSGLKKWELGCEILNGLLEMVKTLNISRNNSLFLKYAHLFLKSFIHSGLSIFEQWLRKNPEKINELLKSLQSVTRYLHNLCCHSKAIKNTAIVGQIPFVRQTVENLVFRVKAALAANNCSSVFWMGNLKNKDIHGDEILSQNSATITEQDNDEDQNDEELPEDDESIDETILNDDITENTENRNSKLNLSCHSSRSNCF